MKAQADANAQAQQAVAQAEIQKNQSKTESEIAIETKKAEMKLQYLQEEVKQKMILMDHEFELNTKLEGATKAGTMNDFQKEDRKDARTRMQASQQSELIEQKNTGGAPKKFESSGHDVLGGGLGLDKFAPQVGR